MEKLKSNALGNLSFTAGFYKNIFYIF